jgi:hypothetical protein
MFFPDVAVHAQRRHARKVNLRPALRAHVALRDRQLLAESREHPPILGAYVMPGDIVDRRLWKEQLADPTVGLQRLAMRPPFGGRILGAQRDFRGARRRHGTRQLRRVHLQLLRKELPDRGAQRGLWALTGQR